MKKISRTSFYFISGLIVVVLLGVFVWSSQVSAPAGTVASDVGTPGAENVTGSRAATAKRVLVRGTYYTVVNLTSSGFSPRTVTINKGEPIRFVNLSNQSMRIVSNTDKSGPLYPTLYQAKTVGKNGVFDFLFDTSGTWGYHNLNSSLSGTGTIVVR